MPEEIATRRAPYRFCPAVNGPAELRPRSAGEVQLTGLPRTIVYALREHGMGTTVLSGLSLHSRPGAQVRFVLQSGPGSRVNAAHGAPAGWGALG
jgi:hypothetical protein